MEIPNIDEEYGLIPTSRIYEPLVVEPVEEHRQTFIVLHGRGGTGQSFAANLLSHPISPTASLGRLIRPLTIRTCFPRAKFIFPTACLGRVTAYQGQLTHQWFDNWSPLHDPEYREELQIEGLAETSSFIHSILQSEIDIIGAKNVVLVGFSQGCAASLVSLLTWQGEPLAATVGMCGWLPFRMQMLERAENAISTNESNQVDHSKDDNTHEADTEVSQSGASKLEKTASWLKHELGIRDTKCRVVPFQHIPVFLGHGVDDGVVRCEFDRLASQFLMHMGIDTRWNEYKGLDHCFSEDMLRDIVLFLDSLEGWEVYS